MSPRRIDLPAAEIANRYREGESIPELAAAYQTSTSTIWGRLQEQGVQMRGAADSNRRRTFPGQSPRPEPPGTTQRQISVRFPAAEWQEIEAVALQEGLVEKSTGRPVLGLAVRMLAMEALAARQRRR
ncbi:helix-turn-helix domain-containing protein [Micromonospora peucetia]|uniref:Helix-turn-helix domain-containing protein n=1 Tax=Micromonospora peucetia TaxID=47871 RepID=A0ABZ1EK04_9ACTN|nr:hypothetical protein [Micromonospora peucetia]WSA34562.1 hypothetical protein OIE14_11210 [Micromonospora peucetia]